MSSDSQAMRLYIGWDVGGWNCDKNGSSRDAIVVLNSSLDLIGYWRGNLRETINEAENAEEWIRKLFDLCSMPLNTTANSVVLGIDTPLGFSKDFTNLVNGKNHIEAVGLSKTNQYLFRQTERFLFECGLTPLSAIKDMIGSQATKGMHVLAKFSPIVTSCGVWSDGKLLTAIEAYPSACRTSETVEAISHPSWSKIVGEKDDVQDALTCALVAYLFSENPELLESPDNSVPASEGWIWVPKDALRK